MFQDKAYMNDDTLRMSSSVKAKYGVVVMLDALGARSLTLEESIRFLQARANFLEMMQVKHDELSQVHTYFNVGLGVPQIVTFGDTIVLSWELPEADPESFLVFLGEWLRPALLTGFTQGLLFRGAFSIGNYVHEEATVIGPAIADAASWYEMADWFGIIATPSCGYRLSYLAENLQTRGEKLDKWYVEYEVPLKNGLSPRMWVASWPAQYPPLNKPVKGISGRELFLAFLRGLPIPIGTERKYANTLEFFDWYQRVIGEAVPTPNDEDIDEA
jgi:hypothetical protein